MISPDMLAGLLLGYIGFSAINWFFINKQYDYDAFSELGEKIPKWLKRTVSILATIIIMIFMVTAVLQLRDFSANFEEKGCAAYCYRLSSAGQPIINFPLADNYSDSEWGNYEEKEDNSSHLWV